MSKLIITRGLPASGKSTRAREWVAEDPVRRARVNRDDMRRMAHDSLYIQQSEDTVGTERAIQAMRDAIITSLLKRNIDVVCDDTNLPQRAARDLRRLAILAGAEFEVWDMTDVTLETCLYRNTTRSAREFVPEDRIQEMWDKFVRPLKGKPFPFPEEPTSADSDAEVVPYVPVPGAPRAVMVDVDGTIALMVGRSPYDATRVHEDQPNQPVIEAVKLFIAARYQVIFCSGRSDECFAETVAWISKEFPELGNDIILWMRKAGDGRKDSIVKSELFDQHIRNRWDVRYVFDDRDQVVDMWRDMGLVVFQVAAGKF